MALGVAGGYFLGRTKKMKLALMLGGMAGGRRAAGPGQLLGQATKLLGQSPELTRLADELRGRLLDAGKGAAVAIATRQVEHLTERMVSRVGTSADAGGRTVGDTFGDRDTTGGGRRSRSDAGQDVEYDEEPGADPGGEPDDLDLTGGGGGEQVGADAGGDEEIATAPRRVARAGSGGRGGRPARGRQGRSDG